MGKSTSTDVTCEFAVTPGATLAPGTKIGNYFVLNLNLYKCHLTEVLFTCKFTDIFTAAGQIQTILQALKCLQSNI